MRGHERVAPRGEFAEGQQKVVGSPRRDKVVALVVEVQYHRARLPGMDGDKNDPVDAWPALVLAEPLPITALNREAILSQLLRNEVKHHRIRLRGHPAIDLLLEDTENLPAPRRPVGGICNPPSVRKDERIGNRVVPTENAGLVLVVVDFDKPDVVRVESDGIAFGRSGNRFNPEFANRF